MSRHGYVEDCDDDPLALGRYRAQVASAMRGKRGQAFLRELAAAMDAMPEKELISEQLIDDDGGCCAIGVVCKSRGIDVSQVDYEDAEQVARAVGIAEQMAREIEYENDDLGYGFKRVDVPKPPGFRWERIEETPAKRWQRMRKWVESMLRKV